MLNFRSLARSLPPQTMAVCLAVVSAMLIVISASLPSLAHWQDLSVGELTISSQRVIFNLTAPTEIVKFADDDRNGQLSTMEIASHQAELTTFINDRIQLLNQSSQRGTLAISASPQPLALPNESLQNHSSLQLTYRWPTSLDELILKYNFFLPDLTTARCLVTIVYAPTASGLPTGASNHVAPQSIIVTPHQREFALISRPLWQQVSSFIGLGIEHILTGYDHILFLFSLLLASHRFRDLLKIVTAFTISHSLTLSLTALNLVSLPSPLVESAIVLSIVYVAWENLLHRDIQQRWLIVLGFGLIHGMGFASILQDIHIPRSQLFTALVSFNLGVEMGQLVIVVLCFLGLQGLRRWMNRGQMNQDQMYQNQMYQNQWHRQFVQWSSRGIIAIGLFWFFQRTVLAIVP